MLEISEGERRKKQTVQVLLTTWMTAGKFGQLWMAHPDNPDTFRDFLLSVGTKQEGNQLSKNTISDMAAIGDIIAPFCKENDIEFGGYVTTKLWTKLRETIPALRRAAKDGDQDTVLAILSDVKALPTRDAIREKYRKQRDSSVPVAVSDIVYLNGKVIVVTVTDAEDLHIVKSALSRITTWDVIAAQQGTRKKITTLKVDTS